MGSAPAEHGRRGSATRILNRTQTGSLEQSSSPAKASNDIDNDLKETGSKSSRLAVDGKNTRKLQNDDGGGEGGDSSSSSDSDDDESGSNELVKNLGNEKLNTYKSDTDDVYNAFVKAHKFKVKKCME